MKGIIFNLLEEVVTSHLGPDVWPDLIDAAGVEGIYTSLGSYPDQEILALVNTAAATLGQDPAHVLRWFGRKSMPILASRYGTFFKQHDTARSFVLSVNEIIHPEVRKLYSGAGCPHFHFSDTPDGRLILGYQSPRRLCALVEGFVEGASDQFAEAVAIEHLSCMADGAPLCRVAVDWAA